jgi:hypothetical protein
MSKSERSENMILFKGTSTTDIIIQTAMPLGISLW